MNVAATEPCVECGAALAVYETPCGLQSEGDISTNLPGIVCVDCSFDLVRKVPDPPGLVCVRVLTPELSVAALETIDFLRPIEESALFFMRLFPRNGQVIASGAIRIHAAGLTKTAEMLLEGCLEQCDDPIPLQINLAAIYGMDGAPERGLRLLEQVPPTTERYHTIRGNLLKETGNWEDAAASWRRAIATDPADPVAWRNVGHYLTHVAKDLFEAEQHYRQACDAFPDNRRFRAYLGDTLFFQERLLEARTEYETALTIQDADEAFERSVRRMLDSTRD